MRKHKEGISERTDLFLLELFVCQFCLTVGLDGRSVFCEGIACGEFVGDRRWIK